MRSPGTADVQSRTIYGSLMQQEKSNGDISSELHQVEVFALKGKNKGL